MDTQRGFEILELNRHATLEDAKQAYKDLVNVWHPDRFSDNPRLRLRAENKLKEINLAFETVKASLKGNEAASPRAQNHREGGEGRRSGTTGGHPKDQGPADRPTATEAAFEAGTRVVLNTWWNLSTAVRRFWSEATRSDDDGDAGQGPCSRTRESGQGHGKCRRARQGRGRM